MERKKYLNLILLIVINFHCFGKVSQEKVYKAYVFDDMSSWKLVLDSLENSKVENFDLANYYYGYIGWCISMEDEDEASLMLEKLQKLIEKLKTKDVSMYHAYLSSTVGFEVGLNFYLAPFIGMYAMTYATRAVSEDNENYFAYLQVANNYFYTPTIFGGSKEKSIIYYLKAESLLKNRKNNWNYISILYSIYMNYIELGNRNQAKKYYKKLKRVEPKLVWLNKEILEPQKNIDYE